MNDDYKTPNFLRSALALAATVPLALFSTGADAGVPAFFGGGHPCNKEGKKPLACNDPKKIQPRDSGPSLGNRKKTADTQPRDDEGSADVDGAEVPKGEGTETPEPQ